MIKDVEIENFRCFGKSKFSGFGRINLIGGKNNAGKTAFLEALYLNHSPQVSTLMQLRGMNQEVIKAYPEKAWDNLFLNQNQKSTITIKSLDENEVANMLAITVGNSKIADKESLSEVLLHDDESDISILNFTYRTGETAFPVVSLVAHSEGTLVKANGGLLSELNLKRKKIYWIPASGNSSHKSLAKLFEKCYLKGYCDKVMNAFQIIDSSIKNAITLNIGEPLIYLARQPGNVMPLALFGDSLNRVADLFLKLVNNQKGILLIDEIENGIHHTKQKELWEMLFDLTAEFNVQIFATTHSLEMLQAFAEVASQIEGTEAGFYFEFARHIKTNQIIGIKYEMDVLEYGLTRQKGVRGE